VAAVIARVTMPGTARAGEVIKIKALLRHAMETGYRVDASGVLIPRNIITRLTVDYDGERIFAMRFTQGIAANPYVAFATRATRSGTLVFLWEDEYGALVSLTKTLQVDA
jgi:sulfur-oxidizing protein SoxZ